MSAEVDAVRIADPHRRPIDDGFRAAVRALPPEEQRKLLRDGAVHIDRL